MASTVLSERVVREMVAPFEERIARCLRRGVARWEAQQVDLGPAVSNRTRASLIFDFMADEAEREFINDPRVRVRRKRGLPFLLIDGRVAVRFKKFRNARLAVSTGRTKQQEQINAHQLMIAESDVAPTWLTAGYRLADTGMAAAQYAMTFTDNGQVVYVVDLDGPALLAPVVQVAQPPGDRDGLVIRPSRTVDSRSGDVRA